MASWLEKEVVQLTSLINNLTDQSRRLLRSSLALSTKNLEKKFETIITYIRPQNTCLLIALQKVANYMGYLFSTDLTPLTISFHISAISYVQKNVEHRGKYVRYRKLLIGCAKQSNSLSDYRLPIT